MRRVCASPQALNLSRLHCLAGERLAVMINCGVLSSGCVVEVSLRQATQEVHLQIPWIRKCQFMMTVFFLKEQQVSRA